MNTKSLLKLIIKLLFWTFGIFIALVLLGSLYVGLSNDLLLFVMKEGNFSSMDIITLALKAILDLLVVILLYFYIYKHRFITSNEDRSIRVILILCYIAYLIARYIHNKTIWDQIIISPILFITLLFPLKTINLFSTTISKNQSSLSDIHPTQ